MRFRHLPVTTSQDTTQNFEQLQGILPGLVAKLPSPAIDGQEVYYQNPAMAAKGVAWHLRYRADSASAYKWEFVGGPSLVETSEPQTGPFPWGAGNINTWQGSGALGALTMSVPLTGEYQLVYSALFYLATNKVGIYIGQNSVVATRYEPNVQQWVLATTAEMPPSAHLTEGHTIELQWNSEGATEQYVHTRSVKLLPVRVG